MFLFSLQAIGAFLEHSQIFMVGLFLRRKLTAKSLAKKPPQINRSLIEVNISLRYFSIEMINFHISSYRGATGATFIHANA